MNDLISKPKIDERVLNSFVHKKSMSSTEIYATFQHYTDDYNAAGITCIITKKDINDWEKVFQKRLKKYLPQNINCFVAGGSVLTYILYGNELLIRDYDIFAPDQEIFDVIDKHLISSNPKEKYENNYTKHYSFGHIEIDLIKKPFTSIEKLFNNFDIDLCRVGFEVINQSFTFKKQPDFKQIFLRILKIPNIETFDFKKNGIKLFKRLLKYSSKGFKIEYNTLMQFYSRSLMAYSDKEGSEKDMLRMDVLSTLESQIKKDYQFDSVEYDEKAIPISELFRDLAAKSPILTSFSSTL